MVHAVYNTFLGFLVEKYPDLNNVITAANNY